MAIIDEAIEEAIEDPTDLNGKLDSGEYEEIRTDQPRNWWLFAVSLVLAALLGAVAGFAASGLHPGPRGHQGAAGLPGAAGAASSVPGPAGPPGATGATGPAGAAATTTDLGVCESVNYGTVYGVSVINSVTINSPSKHADGTTYCSYGSYVPVTPQADK